MMVPPGRPMMPPGAPQGGPMMPPQGAPMVQGAAPMMAADDARQLELLRLLTEMQNSGLPSGETVPKPYAPPMANGRQRNGA